MSAYEVLEALQTVQKVLTVSNHPGFGRCEEGTGKSTESWQSQMSGFCLCSDHNLSKCNKTLLGLQCHLCGFMTDRCNRAVEQRTTSVLNSPQASSTLVLDNALEFSYIRITGVRRSDTLFSQLSMHFGPWWCPLFHVFTPGPWKTVVLVLVWNGSSLQAHF